MKNSLLKTSLVAFFVSTFILVNAQTTSQKDELKPITTPLKKESPRFTAVERPISKNSSVPNNNVSNGYNIKSNTVSGEGKYLMFTKKIMEVSVTGQIPDGFPKHIKGQSKEQYVEVMKTWAKENMDKIKPEYHNKIN